MKEEVWMNEHDLFRCGFEIESNGEIPVIAGYLRVAGHDSMDNSSLRSQEECIRSYCNQTFPGGYKILWIADNDISGNLPLKQAGLEQGQYRTGLTLVTQLIKAGIVKHVCVYKFNERFRCTSGRLDFCTK